MDERLLAIGEFSRATRLSVKALRLYDDLGLLPPARVDPRNGYRSYAPGQVEDALLVAWLRRIGMPLAGIRDLLGLPPLEVAERVRAFWAAEDGRHDARRDLAAFLVDHLSRKGNAVNSVHDEGQGRSLAVRYAVASDIGLVREHQQDVAHAGPGLLAVADGLGVGGDAAARTAVDSLAWAVEEAAANPGADVVTLLQEAVATADAVVVTLAERARAQDAGAHVGTTLSAVVPVGSRLALVHIGDSRVYLLRGGGLFRVTHDDSLVQAMVDDGRLTPEEAWSHPQRAMLATAIGLGSAAADVRLHDARDGDRWLVCTDGLWSVVSEAAIRETLSAAAQPQDAVDALMAAVRSAGAPDNVSLVVADVAGA